MSKAYDAIIIGAGIIGCCIAYEMSKRGDRTLNIDFQPAAGGGSTANSCGSDLKGLPGNRYDRQPV